MSPSLASFLFEAFNFTLLAAGVGWLFFRPVRDALDAELAERAAALEAAKKEAEEARQASAAARDEATQARSEARVVRDGARNEAEAARAEILKTAREDVAREREAFEAELRARSSEQLDQLAGRLGEVASSSVRRLMDELAGPELDVALVRAAVTELRRLPEAVRREARVEAARPLPSEALDLLAEVIGSTPVVRIVDALGAGVRVVTSGGQVDATASSIARTAARQVSAGLAGVERGESTSSD